MSWLWFSVHCALESKSSSHVIHNLLRYLCSQQTLVFSHAHINMAKSVLHYKLFIQGLHRTESNEFQRLKWTAIMNIPQLLFCATNTNKNCQKMYFCDYFSFFRWRLKVRRGKRMLLTRILTTCSSYWWSVIPPWARQVSYSGMPTIRLPLPSSQQSE